MIKGMFLFYVISAILGILFINSLNFFYLVLFFLSLLFVYRKVSIQPIIIMVVCFLFFCLYRPNTEKNLPFSYQQFEVKVKSSKDTYSIVNYNKQSILLYTDQKYTKNDVLSFNANLIKIENSSSLYGFDFKKYLRQQRIYYQFTNVDQIILKAHNPPLSSKIIQQCTKNLKQSTYTMVSMLLFNNHNVDDLIYEDLKTINALHLFVVSGFHILFLNRLFCFLFRWLFKDKVNYFSFLFLIFYCYLLDFSVSVFRAVFCLIFSFFDKKEKFTALDRLSISGFVLLFIEPLTIFSLSFIMSYTLAFILIMSKNIFLQHNKITNLFLLSFICFMIMLPIQLIINYKINFVSFFSNIIFSYVVIFLFILSIISMLFSFFKLNLFHSIYQTFFQSVHWINNQFQPLIFGKPSTIFILVFYLLCFGLLIGLEKKKYKNTLFFLFSMIAFTFFLYHKNKFIGYEQLTYLDVYQGDCTVIESKWGRGVMLIDTGGIKNYDIANQKIIPYLEYRGIKQIDLIVISHNDYDHCGALDTLKANFKVLKVINDPSVQEIRLGSLHFTNLNKYYTQYEDSNNQSIVLYGKIANATCLFTGDIDFRLEKQIIQDYPTLQIDILKVAHHGSKNSTCKEFLEVIQPKIAIISVGKNYYGHPTKEVLNLLKQYHATIYRTDLNGTIKIAYPYFFYYIITAKS